MKTSSAFNYMKNSFSLHSWMTALPGSVFLASGFSFFLSEIWIYHIILFWSTNFCWKICSESHGLLVLKLFFTCCFQHSLLVFNFWDFNYILVWGPLHSSYLESMGFLDLGVYFFSWVRRVFHPLFLPRSFLSPFSLPLLSWICITWILIFFILSFKPFNLSSSFSFFIPFTFCSSNLLFSQVH